MSASVIAGAIPALEQLQSSFTTQAGNVQSLMSQLSAELEEAYWQGPAADRFRAAWGGEYRPALAQLAEALLSASSEVGRRSQALLEAGS